LEKHSTLLRFLDQIRDEAHRFAITYHKKLRGNETVKSEMGDIPGIGKMRERELLKHFGSVKKIKEATVEELSKAPKMNLNSAQKVFKFFHPPDSPLIFSAILPGGS
jgi:excinuclease ABC subunit C